MGRIRLISTMAIAAAINSISHITAFYMAQTRTTSLQTTGLYHKAFSLKAGSSFSSLRMFGGDGESELEGTDRVLACLPYVLPLIDGADFGKYIFMRFPILGIAEKLTLGGLIGIFDKVPFAGIIVFVALSFGSRNPDIPRPIRFSMQQAILIDIVLIIPSVLGGVAEKLPRTIVEPSTNFVFYCYAIAVGYSILSNLNGRVPNQIPFISSTADDQIGPF